MRAVSATGQTLAMWNASLSGVAATPVITPATLAGPWPLGSFELRLEAEVGGTWNLLDRARVQAAERTPPTVVFTAPDAGAIVRSSALVSVVASARQAPLAQVEVSTGSGWSTLQPLNLSAGEYGSTTPLPAVDGPLVLQARASDTQGVTSSVVTRAIVIDNTPPAITVDGVEPGGSYRDSAVPVITIAEPHPATQSITLDGAPYVSGQSVTSGGTHTLLVHATDVAGNESELSLAFQIETPVALSGSLAVSPTHVAIGEIGIADALAAIRGQHDALRFAVLQDIPVVFRPCEAEGLRVDLRQALQVDIIALDRRIASSAPRRRFATVSRAALKK